MFVRLLCVATLVAVVSVATASDLPVRYTVQEKPLKKSGVVGTPLTFTLYRFGLHEAGLPGRRRDRERRVDLAPQAADAERWREGSDDGRPADYAVWRHGERERVPHRNGGRHRAERSDVPVSDERRSGGGSADAAGSRQQRYRVGRSGVRAELSVLELRNHVLPGIDAFGAMLDLGWAWFRVSYRSNSPLLLESGMLG